jgi:hypothetical protein
MLASQEGFFDKGTGGLNSSHQFDDNFHSGVLEQFVHGIGEDGGIVRSFPFALGVGVGDADDLQSSSFEALADNGLVGVEGGYDSSSDVSESDQANADGSGSGGGSRGHGGAP